ncbi:MAG: hypothetical protein U0P30_17525 [Vicinamibacterales bacterium]
MSRFLGALAGLMLLCAPRPTAAPDTCADAAREAVRQGARLVDAGDDAGALDALRARYDDAATCPAVAVAAWSLRGWSAAQAAATRGGTPESLADTTAALATLEMLGRGVSEAGYASALLHAAAAAAQSERDELQLWLDQARDVSRRIALGGAVPRWPRPIDRAEGELWQRVDDFELAERAFMAAVKGDDSAASFAGLARARDRRGNRAGACEAYRAVTTRAALTTPVGIEARGYLLLCTP